MVCCFKVLCYKTISCSDESSKQCLRAQIEKQIPEGKFKLYHLRIVGDTLINLLYHAFLHEENKDVLE